MSAWLADASGGFRFALPLIDFGIGSSRACARPVATESLRFGAASEWTEAGSRFPFAILRFPMAELPPDRLRKVGGPSDEETFVRVGKKWRARLEAYGLRPEDRVLDAGCGSGRIAMALTSYITTGSYEGFDVSAPMLRWCEENITPAHPNFHFQVADVYNRRYNPRGSSKAADYIFPYADSSFDFAFLTSVFTHMFPPDVDHYLGELARVLRPGGRCVATYYLLNDQTEAAIAKGTWPKFRHRRPGYRFTKWRQKEGSIALDEPDVRAMYERHALTIDDVRYGSWAGGPNDTGQDVIAATRRA